MGEKAQRTGHCMSISSPWPTPHGAPAGGFAILQTVCTFFRSAKPISGLPFQGMMDEQYD
jgi:hypothetical protein